MTLTRTALVSALVCTVTASAFAQEIEKVTVTLESGVFETQLPFDVPLLLTGAIATTVEIVSASYALLPNEPDALLDCEDETLVWRRAGTWRRLQGSETTNFELPMPRLQANRYYCLKFSYGPPYRRPQPQELAAFQDAATRQIDPILRTVTDPGNLDAPAATRLRLALIAAAEAAAGGAVVVPSTSFFNREADPEVARVDLANLLLPVLQEQLTRQSQITNFDGNVAAARKQAAPVTQTEFDAIRKAAAAGGQAQDAAAAQTLVRVRQFAFAGAPLDGLEDEPMNRLAEDWAPDAVAARRARLRRTIDALTALATWAAAPSPAVVTQLDPGGAARLATLGTVINDVNKLLTSTDQNLTSLQTALTNRINPLPDVVVNVTQRLLTDVRMLASTVGTFTTRHSWYISADLGLAYTPFIDEIFPYIGTNIYFRPVNKAAPLSALGNFGQTFTRRASAMIGITFGNSEITVANRRAPLFNNQYLLLGGGFRMTDAIRLASGILVMKAFDANPLVTGKEIEATWFLSLSFDWDVRGSFGKAFGFTPPPEPPSN